MSMNLPPVLRQRYQDADGNPLAGGKLYTYQSGTTTPQATYTDATGGTPNANPIILDANGECAMWLDPALSYKFVLKNSSEVTQWTVDVVAGQLNPGSVVTVTLADGILSADATGRAKMADGFITSPKFAATIVSGMTSATLANDDYVFIGDTSGSTFKKALASDFKSLIQVATKTATYTVTTAEEMVPVNASSGGFTVNLYTAVGNTGRQITIYRVDQTLANQVTIDGNGAETINGSSTFKLCTQYESVTLVSDGSGWVIKNHIIPTAWTSYTLTIGGSGSAPNPGSPTANIARWRRDKTDMIVEYEFETGAGGGAAAGNGTYLFPLPSGVTSSFSAGAAGAQCLGSAGGYNGAGYLAAHPQLYNSTNIKIFNPGGGAYVSHTHFQLGASVIGYSFLARVPITGWEG